MAKTPIFRSRLIGTPVDRQKLRDFHKVDTGTPAPETLHLGEYLAAIRREIESVALIAASDDPLVPQFQVADVELDLAYAVDEVTDEGMRIVVARGKLAEMPDALIHRVKLRLVDPAVAGLPHVSTKG